VSHGSARGDWLGESVLTHKAHDGLHLQSGAQMFILQSVHEACWVAQARRFYDEPIWLCVPDKLGDCDAEWARQCAAEAPPGKLPHHHAICTVDKERSSMVGCMGGWKRCWGRGERVHGGGAGILHGLSPDGPPEAVTPWSSEPSIPSAPNSLTSTAHLSAGAWPRFSSRKRLMVVVLPLPKGPVMMFTGTGSLMWLCWDV
jgi:hypothetical protein